MRPYWKGYLKLALVSCPIALHAACSSAERPSSDSHFERAAGSSTGAVSSGPARGQKSASVEIFSWLISTARSNRGSALAPE